jgi:hypothetical protein
LGDTDVAGLNGLFGAIAPPAVRPEEKGESGQSSGALKATQHVDARARLDMQLIRTADAMQTKDADGAENGPV